MNENFFDNFWISEQEPEDLPEDWIWVYDFFDLETLISAYDLLYPEGEGCWGKQHYICIGAEDYDIVSWSSAWGDKHFVFIWRPIMESNNEKDE